MHIAFIYLLWSPPHLQRQGFFPLAVRGSASIKNTVFVLPCFCKTRNGTTCWETQFFFFCLHFEKGRDIIDTHHFLFSTLSGFFIVFASPVNVAVGYLLITNSVVEVASFHFSLAPGVFEFLLF